MSRERMSRAYAIRIRRVRGFLLAVVLLIALAAYAGSRSPAPRGSRPELNTSQSQRLQAAAAAMQTPELSQQDELDGELGELVNGVLDEIVWDGMSQLEEARAVFNYVHDNITYTGHSEKSDWKTGAYDGLATGKGDCFTYYAVSRAMLTALEIDNLPVERSGGETLHFWNLVNCGDGWYHFDACPRSSKLPPFLSFMFTDQQAADFTAEAGRCYYDFDGSLLPERAVEAIAEG